MKLLAPVGVALVAFGAFMIDAPRTYADSSAVLARFYQPLSRIDRLMSKVRDPERTEQLDSVLGARAHAFQLQSLFEIYKDHFGSPFSRFKKEAKALEDAVGAYAYAIEILDYAQQRGADAAKIRGLKERKVEAARRFSQFLVRENWVGSRTSAAKRLMKELESINWMPYAEDKRYVVNRMANSIEKIDRTQYDMRDLEDGIHELRRQLRWFQIEAVALNGLIVTHNDRCPLATATNQPVADKYKLNENASEMSPCSIPACLYRGMTSTVSRLGDLKDEGQGSEVVGGHPNSSIYKQAEAIYRELRDSRLLSLLTEELRKCGE